MSQDIVTEFLGAFKIQADSEQEYLHKREALLGGLTKLGINILDITPIEGDIGAAAVEWQQWNKIDQIIEELQSDAPQEEDPTITVHAEDIECVAASPSDGNESDDNAYFTVPELGLSEEKLFNMYPKLAQQLEKAAHEAGESIEDFEFLKGFREELDLELIYQSKDDDEIIAFVEVSLDATGDTRIEHFLVEQTYTRDAPASDEEFYLDDDGFYDEDGYFFSFDEDGEDHDILDDDHEPLFAEDAETANTLEVSDNVLDD